MLAKLQTRGRDILGLHIGKANARRYFRAANRTVELELDHLRIDCQLNPGFWRDRPEITDPRLRIWLAAKCSCHEVDDMPTGVEMLSAGEASFRLQLAPVGRGREMRSSEKLN